MMEEKVALLLELIANAKRLLLIRPNIRAIFFVLKIPSQLTALPCTLIQMELLQVISWHLNSLNDDLLCE
jgi:hypothetical protein